MSTVYHSYVRGFGFWMFDPETLRHYAYDLRTPPQFHGVITGQDAAEFRKEIDAEGDRMMGRE
jgi:hypothetical protein